MQVVQSIYEQWSVAPSSGSDVPEKGTDLTVVLNNWPEGYTPHYIIQDGWKTLSATIADTVNGKVTVTGRIIRTSTMMNERSEQVEQSDRLVYAGPDGESGFIEINDWQQAEGN